MRTEFSVGQISGFDVDWYQPTDYNQRYFVNPEVSWTNTTFNVFEPSVQIGEVDVSFYQARLGFGRNFGDNAVLALELLRGSGDIELGAGDIPQEVLGDFDIGEYKAIVTYDSLDNLNFPLQGLNWNLGYRKSSDTLGSDEDYQQYALGYSQFFTNNNNTFFAQLQAGYSEEDDVPIYRDFDLGGFGSLSGLEANELLGPHYGLLNFGYYRRLDNGSFFPVFAGVSLEYGNVWQTHDDISFDNSIFAGSIFIGAETYLGPVYLAYGRTEDDDNAVYLFLGNPFNPDDF